MQSITVKSSGILSKVEGQVWLQLADGTEKQLLAGDRVQAGDVLHLADGAHFALMQDDGGELAMSASPDLGQVAANATALNSTDKAQLAELQKAILAGEDPTQIFKASAAGPAPAAGGATGAGGDSGYVAVARTGSELLASAGYTTAGNPGSTGPTPTTMDQLIQQNHPPVAQPDQILLQEDSITNVSGSLLANDSDADGDVLAVTLVNGSAVTTVSGQYGVLIWSADGGFSYALNNDLVQSLAQGQSLTETFTYQISDGNGGFSTSTLTVVIEGTNDAPVATANTNAVTEDSSLVANGNMLTDDNGFGVDSDVDNNAQLSVSAVDGSSNATIQGLYGTLTWNADGSYTYTLNNALAAVQGLSAGETLTETFTYTLTDEFGATSTATLTITINGTDDGVSINGLDGAGAEQTVYEANLANGSDPNAAALTQGGTFSVTAVDGLNNVTIGGVAVVVNGVFQGAMAINGAHGVLTITGFDGTNFTYSYVLTSNADHSNGDVLDQFNVTLTDVDGSSDSASLDIRIVDDAPVAANDAGSVSEDGTLVAGGNVMGNDTQGADGATVQSVNGETGLVGVAIQGLYGTLTLNADGTYTYTLDNTNAAVQGLSAGETLTESFNYSLLDGDGDSSAATLTITINGADDGVSINGLDGTGAEQTVYEANLADGSDPNAAALTQGGTFSITAVDGLNNVTIGGVAVVMNGVFQGPMVINGAHGVLTITGFDGTNFTYSYVLTSNADHSNGDVLDQFNVNLTDVDGSSDNASLDIQIVDDAPSIQVSGPSDVAEQQSITGAWSLEAGADGAQVQVIFNGHAYALGTAIDTGYGTLTVNADGTWSFQAANSLDNSSQLALNFELQAVDGDGDVATDSQLIRIMDGTAPTGADQLNLTVDEAHIQDNVTGDLFFTAGSDPLGNFQFMAPNNINVDVNGDSMPDLTWVVSADGQTLTGYINGQAALVLSLSWSDIAVGETGNVTVHVQLLEAFPHPDGQGANEITVSGIVVGSDTDGDNVSGTVAVTVVDDVPTANNDSGSVTEDSALVANGNVMGNDNPGADGAQVHSVNGDTGLVGVAIHGLYGTLTLNADGTYTYTLDNNNAAVQALDDGQTLTESFSYSLLDGDGDSSDATLTITVNGQNDAPVAAADTNWAMEDGASAAGNVLQDLDHSGAPSGNFADHADTDVDNGDSLTVTGISFGANAGSIGVGLAGSYGTLVMNADGSYSYVVDNTNATVNALDDGQTLTETFTYTVSDGTTTTTATLTITIFGSNDAPVAAADTNWAMEDGASAAGNVLMDLDHSGAPSGNFADHADTDVDNGDSLTVTGISFGANAGSIGVGLAGSYGTLVMNADGSYSYVVDNSNATVNALDDGQTLTETFTYTVSDGTTTSTATLTITIFGSNDAPVAAADTNWAMEDGASAAGNVLQDLDHSGAPSGNFADHADTDVDNGDSLTVTGISFGANAGSIGVGLAGSYGTLVMNADGSYSYVVDNTNATVNALDDGQTLTETFTYTVSDGTTTSTATLTITIFGSNDAPVAAADTNWAMEDGASAAGNVLMDLDHSGAPSGNFADHADTDVDNGDSLTVTGISFGANAGSIGVGLAGSYGTLVMNADGSYSYVVDNSNATVNALDDGQTLTETFTYTVSDGTTTSTATLTITIFGSNDAPVAAADTNWAMEDGASAAGNVLQDLDHSGAPSGNFADHADTDVDNGDSLTVTGISFGANAGSIGMGLAGSYGTLVMNADGSYSYVVDNTNATVNALDDGQTLTETFTYTVSDGTTTSTATLTITIFGSNDAPVAAADTNWAMEDGASAAGNVLMDLEHSGAPSGNFADHADTDVDNGDSLTVTGISFGANAGSIGVGLAGSYGTLVMNADGSYSYVVDNSNATVNALDDGQTLTETFTYTVSDGTTTSTATLTITIFGSNDAPVAAADTNWAMEDGASAAGNVLMDLEHSGAPSGNFADHADTDVDNGDSLTVTGISFGANAGSIGVGLAGSYGTLVMNADGSYSYVVDNSNATVDALHDGQTLTETFTYTISDGTTTGTATLTITIFGSDDAPVAVNDVRSLTESMDWQSGDPAASVAGNVIGAQADGSADGPHTGAASGDGADTDVDAGDLLTVTSISNGSETLAIANGGTAIIGLYGTLTIYADGSYSYVLDESNPLVDALNVGDNLTDTFTYNIQDSEGNSASAQLQININGADDSTVIEAARSVWLPSDTAQASPDYVDGYPLYITPPTDVDSSLSIHIDSLPAAGTLGYWDGGTFIEVGAGDVLTADQLGQLVYIPDANAASGAYDFNYSVYADGVDVGQSTVTINTVPPNSEPSQSEQIGNGNTPLTSGHDQVEDISLSQQLVDDWQSDPANARIRLLTDFNERSNAGNEQQPDAISALEAEVTAQLVINGITFVVLAANNGVSDWSYAGDGLMSADVLYSNIYQQGHDGEAGYSLADYLGTNPASAGDTWTIIYDDNNGGDYQARFIRFEFSFSDPGDSSINVTGDDGAPNTIFGTDSHDTLFGGSMNDIIYGREGDDHISGGGGDDEIHGGGGNDTIDGGAGNDLIYGGAGNDTISGGDGNDIISGGEGNDIIDGGAGNDVIAGGLGDDLLTGGTGNDTFHWGAGETGTDTITDFTVGQDVLDLANLLQGEENGVLTNYLSFSVSGGDTTISIDVNGDGSGTDQTIVLQGVDLSSYGSDGDIIQALLDSGSLVVDTGPGMTVSSVAAPLAVSSAVQESDLHLHYNNLV
ncbi:retention module-containing protein [Gallaecimonas kandeliae]|uniref:retention module-containing protein n=1 Tax=Gallaecimonas kandeliae TaxID=3029055 RepID=UPI0026498234|nr:retention module-containing protein [Gallaecimonas kandeliae]WKE65129.1 retention module-containing protein [Gallaecimonas kandeliae]